MSTFAKSERVSEVFMALVTAVPMWLFQNYSNTLLVQVLAGGMLLFVLIGLIVQLRTISANLNYYGMENFVTTQNILRRYNYLTAHQIDKVFLVLGFLSTFVFVQAVAFNYWWLIVAAYLYVLSRALAIRFMPPFILVLGHSSKLSFDLVKIALKSGRPLGVKELMFMEATLVGDQLQRGATTARLMNDLLSWQALVELYCVLVKIIVVDARMITPHLREELEIIRRHNLWYKTVVLTERDAAITSELTALIRGVEVAGAIVCDRQDIISKCLRVSSSDKAKCPSSDRPVRSIS
jgi:hypothetical protein